MLDLFDISALILIGLSAFFFKENKDILIVCVNLFSAALLNIINITDLGQYYYSAMCFFEFLFIALGLAMRVKTSILVIFLISLSYNAISFIEFETAFDLFYSNYVLVMRGLVVSMIILAIKSGVNDGINSHIFACRNNSANSYSKLFYWGSK